MTRFRKIMATAAMGALMVASATPAMARPGWGNPGWGGGWRHRGHGVDAGDVILGAIIVGGIAAIASGVAKSNDEKRGGNWGVGWSKDEGTEDAAVDACAQAAEHEGDRYGQDARVEDITSVAKADGGWRVYGVVSAERGDGNSRYGDKSRFSCSVRYGQVEDVQFEDDRSAWNGF